MFEKYLLETFFPWSLKMDLKNTITLLTKEKEKFICDMYNHFANSFKELAVYELHMFRMTFSRINVINCNLITISIPNMYDSIYIAYNDNDVYYFLVDNNNLIFNNKVVSQINNDISSVITSFVLSV